MLKKHITAVKKTIKMWEWLRDNPDKEKRNYFIKHKLKVPVNCECHLCDIWNNGKIICFDEKTNCPLNACEGLGAPFNKWNLSHSKVIRTRNAQIIVDLCKDWLKKYNA